MKFKINLYIVPTIAIMLLVWCGCKKSVIIAPPVASITTSEVFKDSLNTNAAIADMYTQMINTNSTFFYNGAFTIFCGLSADELVAFQSTDQITPLYTNKLTSLNLYPESFFFYPAYQEIYRANACIEGINASKGMSTTAKNQYLGEAKFIRALSYFYLINLFGDVPYVSSTLWQQTNQIPRTPAAQIYGNIIADLKDAQSLPADYLISGGERIRVNKWAAMALLAKVYLYKQDYKNAELMASSVINNKGLFSLNSDLNSVFLKNNPEAIFQLNISGKNSNETAEGAALIPDSPTDYALYYLSPQLLNAFEPGDHRKTAWIDSTNYSGTTYYYPFKYKIGPALGYTGSPTEYYMVLRLAEQYLIRAESEANGQGNGIAGAIADLNIIRKRAGLPNYSGITDKTSVLSAIMHERQIELFAEWGNRWMDLKRTGEIDSVMTRVVPTKIGGTSWKSYQALYPIPRTELQLDPNLKQNPGY